MAYEVSGARCICKGGRIQERGNRQVEKQIGGGISENERVGVACAVSGERT